MPRPLRADEADGIYHAQNRGNSRRRLFWKDDDYLAFERILADGLARYAVKLYAYELMPSHWHLILQPGCDGEMSRFLKWVTVTHTMRFHSQNRTSGDGHIYQGRFRSFPIQNDEHFLTVCRYVERNALSARLVKQAQDWQWGSLWRWLHKSELRPVLISPWPIARRSGWTDRVNEPFNLRELEAVRECARRGRPFGTVEWVQANAARLGLQSTLRARGRPRSRSES